MTKFFKSNLIIFLLIFFSLFLLANLSLAATYYVDQNHPNASDSNPGTEELPWKTIQKAANTVLAGDTVIVKTGNYDERVILPSGKSGTGSAKITFKAEPRRTVYMKGFQGDRNDYIRIEGFSIVYDNTGLWLGGGIWLDGNYWEIVDNYFEVKSVGILPTWQSNRTTNHIYVANNYMYKCNKGFVVAGDGWLVENNEVERLVYYDQDADYSRFFGTNHIIRNNYFHGTHPEEIGSSHTDGFQTFGNNGECAKNIIIENNLVKDFHHQSFMMSGDSACHDNIIIRNNVLADAGAWGICAPGIKNLKVYNNNFINIGIHGIGFGEIKTISGETIYTTGEIKNNIFYNAGSDYWASAGSSFEASNNLIYHNNKTVNQSSYPNDIVNQDPLFVDPANYNFHLQTNSPAINKGITISGFSYDKDGISRPQGSNWDIGAYEYVETAPQPDTTPPAAPRNVTII